jgi:hypothetical protein
MFALALKFANPTALRAKSNNKPALRQILGSGLVGTAVCHKVDFPRCSRQLDTQLAPPRRKRFTDTVTDPEHHPT